MREDLVFTPELRCRRMLRAYAREIGMEPERLLYPSRRKEIAWQRQEFMALARRAGFSSTLLGSVLGLDHTTVLYGAAEAEKRAAGRSMRCPCCQQRLSEPRP